MPKQPKQASCPTSGGIKIISMLLFDAKELSLNKPENINLEGTFQNG
jgi:hypothetical protein